MRYTRLIATFPTQADAERAAHWAHRRYRTLPLVIHEHRCDKPRHREWRWLLLSVLEVEERVEELAAAGGNGR